MNRSEINWGKLAACTAEERRALIPYVEELIELQHALEWHGIDGFTEFRVLKAWLLSYLGLEGMEEFVN